MLTKDEVEEAVIKALEESWPNATLMKLTPVIDAPSEYLMTFGGTGKIPDSGGIQIHSGDTIERVKERVKFDLEAQKKAKS